MMRALFMAGAAFIAAPLSAQDHATPDHGHDLQHQHQHVSPDAHQEPAKEAMDHCAMGHLPPQQCPPADAPAGHEGMDHASMEHAGPQPASDPQAAMDHSAMDHSGHDMGAMDKSAAGAAPESAVPPRALEGPRHAADAIWGKAAMAPSRAALARENGGMKTGMLMIERLEARFPAKGGEEGYLWDAQGWYGGDLNRFVLKTEGEGAFDGAVEDAEVQALFSRAIGPFFDLQAGVRFDPEPDTRTHAVIGVQGLAPYMFHLDAALFLSDRGDLTARIEAEYDQKITQKLILQPRIEVEAAAQDVAERDIGAGLTKIEPGLRLRYEIVREFAPYIGVEYEAKLGETADIARSGGEDPDGFKLLVGLRAWF